MISGVTALAALTGPLPKLGVVVAAGAGGAGRAAGADVAQTESPARRARARRISASAAGAVLALDRAAAGSVRRPLRRAGGVLRGLRKGPAADGVLLRPVRAHVRAA